jgi:hypothetical protein
LPLRAREAGGGNSRRTRRLLTNRLALKPCQQRVRFQRTSTRQQLDCAKTLKLYSQGSRRILISDSLSTCSRSSPHSHDRGQESGHTPTRPSPNSRELAFQEKRHRSARAIQLRNEYAIDRIYPVPANVMRRHGPRLFQVRGSTRRRLPNRRNAAPYIALLSKFVKCRNACLHE